MLQKQLIRSPFSTSEEVPTLIAIWQSGKKYFIRSVFDSDAQEVLPAVAYELISLARFEASLDPQGRWVVKDYHRGNHPITSVPVVKRPVLGWNDWRKRQILLLLLLARRGIVHFK